jgi:hypothetical protein
MITRRDKLIQARNNDLQMINHVADIDLCHGAEEAESRLTARRRAEGGEGE